MRIQQLDSGNMLTYLLIAVSGIFLLYYGQTLFLPLLYGLFIAIVLYPICRRLEQHHLPRSLAIAVSLLLVTLLFTGILWLMVLQVNAFGKDIPALKEKLLPALTELQQWISYRFGISGEAQTDWWEATAAGFSDKQGNLLAGMLSKTGSALYMLFITPVFAALFLYNRRDFVRFLEKIAGPAYHDKLHHILHQTILTYFHFIKGMVFVYLIVGALNSAGLMALGIRHALLFGFLTAIMTIIPYVGIFISALLPITVAWITKDSIWYPLGVIAVFAFVQYLEANVIFPRVVAAQLNLSTWATLVAVIAGGILWGMSGMILFIPLAGILKIVTDSIPEWEALNMLLRRNTTK
jgi:predicted PurR-regulated permease PerM